MNTTQDWKPIESATKDGTPVLLFARLAGHNIHTNAPYSPTIQVGAYRTDLQIWTGAAYRDQREIEIEPVAWMPLPAFPGTVPEASPLTVTVDPDARGVSVGVYQGPRCLYSGAHPIPTGATGEAIKLVHLAVAEDGGVRFMTGRKLPDGIQSCELYATPDYGRAPAELFRAPAAGDALDAASLLNIRFTPVSEGLPDLVEYSPSYAGQWSSKWCAVITARGNIESSQFVLPSSEKEALEAARFNGVWRSGMSPSRVVAWAYMDHIRSAAEAAAIAQQSQRKEA